MKTNNNNIYENNNINNIQTFNSEVFGNVRIIFCQPDEPLFCLKDVCAALALDSKQVIRRLDKGVVSKHPLSTDGGKQTAAFVTEDGLYDVILDSRKAAARAFRKWVTSEVLPQIRRTGRYEMTARLHVLEACVNQLEESNAALQPKAHYAEAVLCSDDTMTVTQIAQDYGVGAATLNQLLRLMMIQRRVGGQWVLYSQHQGPCFVHSFTHYIVDKNDGHVSIRALTRWTQLGRKFICDQLRSRLAILPNTPEARDQILDILRQARKSEAAQKSTAANQKGGAA